MVVQYIIFLKNMIVNHGGNYYKLYKIIIIKLFN